MKDDIIAALDIGSTSVRLAVGQQQEDGALNIIGAIDVPSRGINKGNVKSIEDVTSSISACLEKAERLIGVPISSVWVSVNSPHIKSEKSRGVVAVSRSDGEINNDDVDRALEAARALSVPPNYEILHVIPIKFTVDNQDDIKDPIGMSGVRLEVETLIIQGLSSQIKNLTKAIFRTGLDIDDLVLAPLAAAEAVIDPKQKELGAALVSIGASTTSLAVFEEGELLHTSIIPIGSDHITADIAIGLRCPIGFADKIKLQFGSIEKEDNKNNFSSEINKTSEIDVSKLAKEENVQDEIKTVNKKYLTDIIEARVEEIFEKVDQELKKIDRSGMLPGGIFLTGGGVCLKGMVNCAKKQLRLPVCIAKNNNIQTVIDKVNEVDFLNVLGLVAWGHQMYGESEVGFIKSSRKVMDGFFQKGKKWINSLLPK